MIPPDTRVLDIGCGDGSLLEYLVRSKGVDGRGLELIQQNVNQCVARGLSVVQGDADTDLVFYPDRGFDFVVLSQTLPATRNPKAVLDDLLRIGERAKTSYPGNFGNQSTGTLIAITSATAAGPAPFEPSKIINQNQNTRQDVLQSNEIIGHGSRGQKSKCRIPPALNVKKKQEFA